MILSGPILSANRSGTGRGVPPTPPKNDVSSSQSKWWPTGVEKREQLGFAGEKVNVAAQALANIYNLYSASQKFLY